MCSNAGLYDHSKALYDRTKDEIEHVLQLCSPELNKNKYADEGNAILNKFSHHWENHKVFVKWMPCLDILTMATLQILQSPQLRRA